jgi:acetolactate synthase-1/3 small subunit
VIKVVDLNDYRHIERELMLIKVLANVGARDEVKRMVDIFRGRIIDVTENIFTIEMTGSGEKLDAFIEALDEKLILEVVRSGVSGISRGNKAIQS